MTSPAPNEMKPPSLQKNGSIKIGTVKGIPIYSHFTFLLLLIFFAIGSINGEKAGYSAANLVFVLVLFACVVLHELGHSLVALHYKIPVRDITLYPIGGIARIEKIPTPKQEFWIVFAGPAVNFLIVLLLSFYLASTGYKPTTDFQNMVMDSHYWIIRIAGANTILAIFNLIPAFPMDGGRMLRALLAMKLPMNQATALAASIGQAMAMLAGIAAIFTGQWILLFVAFFIYLGAGQEVIVTRQETLMKDVAIREAMMTDVRTLSHGATFGEAADALLSTSQQDFPVVFGEEVIGLLSRDALLRGLASEGPSAYVSAAMDRNYLTADPDEGLSDFIKRAQYQRGPVLVFESGKLSGMLTTENLMEFLMIRQIRTGK